MLIPNNRPQFPLYQETISSLSRNSITVVFYRLRIKWRKLDLETSVFYLTNIAHGACINIAPQITDGRECWQKQSTQNDVCFIVLFVRIRLCSKQQSNMECMKCQQSRTHILDMLYCLMEGLLTFISIVPLNFVKTIE